MLDVLVAGIWWQLGERVELEFAPRGSVFVEDHRISSLLSRVASLGGGLDNHIFTVRKSRLRLIRLVSSWTDIFIVLIRTITFLFWK